MSCIMLLYGIMPQFWSQCFSLGAFIKLELNIGYILWRDIKYSWDNCPQSAVSLWEQVAMYCHLVFFGNSFCAM